MSAAFSGPRWARDRRRDRDVPGFPIDADSDEAEIEVGMAGTFDVENYGDLLFPLIAQEALARRDRRIRIVAFSMNTRWQRSWPFQVRSTGEIADAMGSLSAMLIGGGQIVRFDKAYPVPIPPGVDVPIAYWLVPALLAAAAGKPVIWNAVGAQTHPLPAPGYDEVLSKVLSASYLVGARDVLSQAYFSKRAADAAVRFIPDTAFSLIRCWPLARESAEYADWRKSLAIERPHIVIQANHALGAYRPAIESMMQSMGDVVAVVLPVCRCHGDRAEGFPPFAGGMVPNARWLAPKLISEIIGRAELVIASSLHACITGLCYGVPVVRAPVGPVADDPKYELLEGFEGLAHIDDAEAVKRVLARGRRMEPRAEDYADRLDRYWDQVADIAVNPRPLHRKHSMAVILGWIAKVCGQIEQRA